MPVAIGDRRRFDVAWSPDRRSASHPPNKADHEFGLTDSQERPA
jgi:hypothetical protein